MAGEAIGSFTFVEMMKMESSPADWRLRGRVLCALFISLAPPVHSPVGAQSLAFDHAPVSCVVAGQYPRLQACAPAETPRKTPPTTKVAQARAHFRAAGSSHWYSVAMKLDQECLVAILPAPLITTPGIQYYLEATGPSMATYRTQDHDAIVASGPGACGDRRIASALSVASVVVAAPAGAPSVPAGFSGTGVTAATGGAAASTAGGLSGAKVGLVIGGVAVAGVGVAVAAGGGGSEADSGDGTPPPGSTGTAPPPVGGTTPTPGTSPPPASSSVLTGRWQGTYTWDCRFAAGTGNAAIAFDLVDTNGRLSGTASYLGGVSTIDSNSFFTASTQGVRIVVLPSATAINNEFVGTLSGSTIAGTTLNGESSSNPKAGCSAPTGPSGTFSVSR